MCISRMWTRRFTKRFWARKSGSLMAAARVLCAPSAPVHWIIRQSRLRWRKSVTAVISPSNRSVTRAIPTLNFPPGDIFGRPFYSRHRDSSTLFDQIPSLLAILQSPMSHLHLKTSLYAYYKKIFDTKKLYESAVKVNKRYLNEEKRD